MLSLPSERNIHFTARCVPTPAAAPRAFPRASRCHLRTQVWLGFRVTSTGPPCLFKRRPSSRGGTVESISSTAAPTLSPSSRSTSTPRREKPAAPAPMTSEPTTFSGSAVVSVLRSQRHIAAAPVIDTKTAATRCSSVSSSCEYRARERTHAYPRPAPHSYHRATVLFPRPTSDRRFARRHRHAR